MKVWQAGPQSVARNLRFGPFNRKSDRRVAEHAEIISPICVLPYVLRVNHQVAAECLLQADVIFVASAGAEGRVQASIALHNGFESVYHGIVAAVAGQHQILIEWRFHSARVREAQHCVSWLEVVSNAEARFSLTGAGDAVVLVPAQSQVECKDS